MSASLEVGKKVSSTYVKETSSSLIAIDRPLRSGLIVNVQSLDVGTQVLR